MSLPRDDEDDFEPDDGVDDDDRAHLVTSSRLQMENLPAPKRCAQRCHKCCTGRRISRRLERRLYTVAAAIGLFTLGTVLLYIGLKLLYEGDSDRGTTLTILGSITFLPGSWASWNLYGSFQRWPGYDFSDVPSYDE